MPSKYAKQELTELVKCELNKWREKTFHRLEHSVL